MTYRHYNIGPSDLVLEIGSGHDPVRRSDVLSDRYVDTSEERGSTLVQDARPFIAADAQALPFKDKVFDYLICQHVLEHANDPTVFIAEITRVSKRGYIETPSRFHEMIYAPKHYHRWVLDYRNGQLIIAPKDESFINHVGLIFTELWRRHPSFRSFHQSAPELMFSFFEWDDHIDYQMLDHFDPQFNIEDYVEAIDLASQRACPRRFRHKLSTLYHRSRALLQPIRQKKRGQYIQRTVDLDSLLCCPETQCRGDLRKENDHYLCIRCGLNYPIVDNIPRFSKE